MTNEHRTYKVLGNDYQQNIAVHIVGEYERYKSYQYNQVNMGVI